MGINRRWLLALGLAVGVHATPEARAHFLFIRICPSAEGGRAAEVYFSEQAEAGDPRFIDKIAHTQLWAQTEPGKFQPLVVRKGADRLRAYLPGSGSVVVVGVCQYGVIARPKEVPFLLRHYPKAMAGKPAELNRMQPRREAPLEIVATVEGERISLVALREGKPLAGAVFRAVDQNLSEEEITAGADGRATWKPASAGRYSVYTRYVTKESGDVDGKKYEEIREFATLAFSWPLGRTGADAEAVALFEEALATRAQWKDFSGFAARIAGEVDGRAFEGKVKVATDGSVELGIDDPAVEAWVSEALESIVMHRRGDSGGGSSGSRPKPVLRFADERDDHPLGRLLTFEGGQFASSYRIKDKQITVVNRRIGGQHMTITVLDNERNGEGFFLPHSYTVQYWDAESGELKRTETVQDRWQRVGSFDLPQRHTVTRASEAGLSVRSFTLSDHRLLERR